MPHPKRIVKPKIPRFSQLVGSDTPALQSPIVSENRRPDRLAAPEKEPFNARVAAYTFAFVGVMLGGLFVGVKSKEITERRQVVGFQVIIDDSNAKNMKICPSTGKLKSMIWEMNC